MYRGDLLADSAAFRDRRTQFVVEKIAVLVSLIAGKAGLIGLVLHHNLAGLRVDHVFLMLHLRIKVDIQRTTCVVSEQLCAAADARHVVVLHIALDRGLRVLAGVLPGLIELLILPCPLCFPAQMLHGITADQQDIGLALHIAGIWVAKQHVNTVHQLHLNLALVCAVSAAVWERIRVEIEVGAEITGDGTVEQGITDAIVKFELLQQTVDLRIGVSCGVAVGVCRRPAVVVSQWLKSDGGAGAGQTGNKKRSHTLQDVEGGLRKSSHGGGIGEVQPLVADEELRVRVDNAVLVGGETVVIINALLVKLPRLCLFVRLHFFSPPNGSVFMP